MTSPIFISLLSALITSPEGYDLKGLMGAISIGETVRPLPCVCMPSDVYPRPTPP